ncbi:hypothetical protein B0H19DRAFT_1056428 [Mycena capillaripes]|nr:hypothetical protein B0H19DRAFT_1056428 [Mycena capillaripes]
MKVPSFTNELSFIPGSATHFPLMFPIAMVVNGCMYTAPSASVGLTSTAIIVGSTTLAVVAWRWRQTQDKAPNVPRGQWVSRTLDEMANGAFAFGSADALQKMREDRKRRAAFRCALPNPRSSLHIQRPPSFSDQPLSYAQRSD